VSSRISRLELARLSGAGGRLRSGKGEPGKLRLPRLMAAGAVTQARAEALQWRRPIGITARSY
jgi:hypothetical protein